MDRGSVARLGPQRTRSEPRVSTAYRTISPVAGVLRGTRVATTVHPCVATVAAPPKASLKTRSRRRHMNRFRTLTLALLGTLAIAPSAFAQDGTDTSGKR